MFQCEVTSFPKPVVTWYKEQTKVDTRESGTLRLSSVKFEDRGRYRCEAVNFVGHAQASTELVVNGNINEQKLVVCVMRFT